jgi:hypothetical protein
MAELIVRNRIWWNSFLALMAIAAALAIISIISFSNSENAWGASALGCSAIFIIYSIYTGVWIRPLGVELGADTVILHFIGRWREVQVSSIIALPDVLDPSHDGYIRIEDGRTLPVRCEVCQAMLEIYPFLTLRTESKRKVSLW